MSMRYASLVLYVSAVLCLSVIWGTPRYACAQAAAFTDRVVLLADRRDNQPLPTAEGPLRLVIPDEKRHARWVRQVVSIHLRRAS